MNQDLGRGQPRAFIQNDFCPGLMLADEQFSGYGPAFHLVRDLNSQGMSRLPHQPSAIAGSVESFWPLPPSSDGFFSIPAASDHIELV